MKILVRTLTSLFDVALKSGPIGLMIFFSVITASIAAVIVTVNVMASNTKSLYCNTYEYEVPISYEIIDEWTATGVIDADDSTFLKTIKWTK